MRVLVLNAGSSSLKASVIDTTSDATLASSRTNWQPDAGAADTRSEATTSVVRNMASRAGRIDTVGHRVVHGGSTFTESTRVTEEVLDGIERLDELAPLHNHLAVETILATRSLLPDLDHVACFDTAFHSGLEEEAWRYPVPRAWETRWGIRRFGFHGLSVTWALERAAVLLARTAGDLGLIVAHLGSGSSVTAVAGGKSVATSMGFTPLEGLMMGTRSGSIDPGILLHVLRKGVTVEALADELEHRSGLLAVSARTADMADLESAASGGDESAALSLAINVRRAAEGNAAAATSLPRLDALVFTGGIGEHAAPVRTAIGARLGALGIEPPRRPAGDEDEILSLQGSRVQVLRIRSREDVVIARETVRLTQHPTSQTENEQDEPPRV
jgi:acetate kinase